MYGCGFSPNAALYKIQGTDLTSCCPFLTIIKQLLLKRFTLPQVLNIENPNFEQMVSQIYPTELQLNKANSSDTEALFLDLDLSITNGIVLSKMYDNGTILILK